MTTEPLVLDVPILRRLQLVAQGLAGRPARDIPEVVKTLRRIQLDPTNAVARSHELVLWSRLGAWDREELRRLLEDERSLFEFAAFIAPTAHWPIFAAAAAAFPIGATVRARRATAWLHDNGTLRRHVIDAISRHGPLPTSAFDDLAARGWSTSGWNAGKNVSRMLELLAQRGTVIRAGRRGTERLWDLPERWLPASAGSALPLDEALRLAIDLAVRARGAAAMPARPPYAAAPWPLAGLPRADVLAARDRLVANGTLLPATVDGQQGDWFVHRDHLGTLEAVRSSLPKPRTTLLSPFDAIVADRDALEAYFGFRYRLEIYVPPAKRQFGYFVLPILHGERFIGRIDPRVDRERAELVVNHFFAEPDAPLDATTGAAIGRALVDLARFAGAVTTVVRGTVPGRWAAGLRRHRSITIARP